MLHHLHVEYHVKSARLQRLFVYAPHQVFDIQAGFRSVRAPFLELTTLVIM